MAKEKMMLMNNNNNNENEIRSCYNNNDVDDHNK